MQLWGDVRQLVGSGLQTEVWPGPASPVHGIQYARCCMPGADIGKVQGQHGGRVEPGCHAVRADRGRLSVPPAAPAIPGPEDDRAYRQRRVQDPSPGARAFSGCLAEVPS